MKKRVLVLTYTILRMIDEKIDEDNYLSQSEEILQTERCKEDGRLLVNDSLIPLFLLKQICQERIYRFRWMLS